MALDPGSAQVNEIIFRNGAVARMAGWVGFKKHWWSRENMVYLILFGEVLSTHESIAESFPIAEINVRNATVRVDSWFSKNHISITKGKRNWCFIFGNSVEKDLWADSLLHANRRRFSMFYKREARIAVGAHSKVYCVTDARDPNLQFAVKVVDKVGKSRDELVRLRRQLFMQSVIDHPFIVKAVDIFCTVEQDHIIMEKLSGGTLDSMLVDNGGTLPESYAKVIMRQLFEALAYLHSKSIVHRNLKPQNILLSSRRSPFAVAICGFHSATFFSSQKVDEEIMHTSAGSPAYRAVEICNQDAYGPLVDMWSAGVILHRILSGKMPFRGSSRRALEARVKQGFQGFAGSIWTVSPQAQSLIRQLLQSDPRKRVCAIGALCHDWFCTKNNPPTGSGRFCSRDLQREEDDLIRTRSSPEARQHFPLCIGVREIAQRGFQKMSREKPASLEYLLRSSTARRQLRAVLTYRRKLAVIIIAMISVFRMKSFVRMESVTRLLSRQGSAQASNLVSTVNRRELRDRPSRWLLRLTQENSIA